MKGWLRSHKFFPVLWESLNTDINVRKYPTVVGKENQMGQQSENHQVNEESFECQTSFGQSIQLR